MSDLATRLEQCYSGAVYDVLRGMGYPNQVLPHTIRPLETHYKLAGKIYTVSGYVDQTLDAHQTLLSWTALLSKAPKDSVVICQPNNHLMALMGELSAETLQFRGVRGYIVDGGCRDSEFITKIGFSVFCSFFTPIDVVGRWVADRFAEPITIGQVTISSGDMSLQTEMGLLLFQRLLPSKL
jgi:4-hydroxy-4-methyl-2-oxoglutarate aldolase